MKFLHNLTALSCGKVGQVLRKKENIARTYKTNERKHAFRNRVGPYVSDQKHFSQQPKRCDSLKEKETLIKNAQYGSFGSTEHIPVNRVPDDSMDIDEDTSVYTSCTSKLNKRETLISKIAEEAKVVESNQGIWNRQSDEGNTIVTTNTLHDDPLKKIEAPDKPRNPVGGTPEYSSSTSETDEYYGVMSVISEDQNESLLKKSMGVDDQIPFTEPEIEQKPAPEIYEKSCSERRQTTEKKKEKRNKKNQRNKMKQTPSALNGDTAASECRLLDKDTRHGYSMSVNEIKSNRDDNGSQIQATRGMKRQLSMDDENNPNDKRNKLESDRTQEADKSSSKRRQTTGKKKEKRNKKKPIKKMVPDDSRDRDEDKSVYSGSRSDINQPEKLISKNTEQGTNIDKSSEELSEACLHEATDQDDIPENSHREIKSGPNEEPLTIYPQLCEKSDDGKNGSTTDIPHGIKRKGSQIVLENEPGLHTKQHRLGSDQTPYTNGSSTELNKVNAKTCKGLKRKQKKDLHRTKLGQARSSRTLETYARGDKQKHHATFPDVDRGKNVKDHKPSANDDPWKTVMWVLSFYGVIGHTFMTSSGVEQCFSIITVSAAGLCICYFLSSRPAVDTTGTHSAETPITVPKKSSIKECEPSAKELMDSKDPYRAEKIHRWIYFEIYNYIPVFSVDFDRFRNFASIYLNPREVSECKTVIDYLHKLESKGIISVGKYTELMEMQKYGLPQYITDILKDPETYYNAKA